MNQVKTIKSLKLDQWFLDQVQKPGSVPGRFYWNFLLKFILENLDQVKKQEFLHLLSEQKTDQVLPTIFENIPDFENKFAQAFGKKLAELKVQALENK